MSLNKQIVRLAVPSILANITIPLVGMVDTAIAGHLGDAVAIGGIAIGTMLFDLLYWNFGFLRVGTSGMTAQAYGRECQMSDVRCQMSDVGCQMSVVSSQWSASHAEWLEAMRGLENEPERGSRCARCFYYRMLATAKKAQELGIPYFATTLASSRWKNLEQINAAGEKAAEDVGCKMLDVGCTMSDV